MFTTNPDGNHSFTFDTEQVANGFHKQPLPDPARATNQSEIPWLFRNL
jgi:hypothetical protein